MPQQSKKQTHLHQRDKFLYAHPKNADQLMEFGPYLPNSFASEMLFETFNVQDFQLVIFAYLSSLLQHIVGTPTLPPSLAKVIKFHDLEDTIIFVMIPPPLFYNVKNFLNLMILSLLWGANRSILKRSVLKTVIFALSHQEILQWLNDIFSFIKDSSSDGLSCICMQCTCK